VHANSLWNAGLTDATIDMLAMVIPSLSTLRYVFFNFISGTDCTTGVGSEDPQVYGNFQSGPFVLFSIRMAIHGELHTSRGRFTYTYEYCTNLLFISNTTF